MIIFKPVNIFCAVLWSTLGKSSWKFHGQLHGRFRGQFFSQLSCNLQAVRRQFSCNLGSRKTVKIVIHCAVFMTDFSLSLYCT